MRHDVLQQFLEFDMTFYRKYRGGEIISRMTNDLASAKAAVSGNIIVFARNLIVSISTIIVLFILSFKLTFAVLSSMPIFTVSTMVYSRLAKKFEKIGQ
jgi:subfamily B ATP-binding cassette protein MsbA